MDDDVSLDAPILHGVQRDFGGTERYCLTSALLRVSCGVVLATKDGLTHKLVLECLNTQKDGF